MTIQVPFNPAHFTPADDYQQGDLVRVERQEQWQQIDADTWLKVVIQRPASGYQRASYVREAQLLTGLQPNGRWAQGRAYPGVGLVEDGAAQRGRQPTPPAPVQNAGTDYIAKTYGKQPQS